MSLHKEDPLYKKDDIFQKIIDGELPANKVFETDEILVIHDINPKAKVHLLIIPKEKVIAIENIKKDELPLFVKLFHIVQQVTRMLKIEQGYQCIINNGTEGGQEIPHLHLHILSDI